MTGQHVFNILWLTSLYGVFAMGLSIIVGAARVLNIAHAGVLTWGGIATWFAIARLDLPLPVALLCAIAIGAVGGFLLEVLVFAPLRRRGGGEISELIVSIGALVILTAAARSATDADFLTYAEGALPAGVVSVAGVRASVAQITIILVGVAFALLASLWLRRSRGGTMLRTVSYSTDIAEMLGINTRRVYLLALVIGSAFAGLAGGLLSWTYGQTTFLMGDQLLLRGLVIVILGGFGSIAGAFAGALILATSEILAVIVISNSAQGLVPFVLLIAVLLLRPQGLFAPRVERVG